MSDIDFENEPYIINSSEPGDNDNFACNIDRKDYSSLDIYEDKNNINDIKHIMSDIDPPAIGYILSNNIFNDPITDNSTWTLKNNDLNSNHTLSLDEQDVNRAIVMDLYEYIPYIIQRDSIQPEDYDSNFETYLDSCINACSYLITKMCDIPSWNYNPIEKLLWVHIMLACKYEHRALKYIFNSSYYDDTFNLLTETCKFGLSPIILACRSDDTRALDIFITEKKISLDMLISTMYADIPAYFYCLINESMISYITSKIDVFSLELENGTTPFHFMCYHSSNNIEYVINNNLISKENLNKDANGLSCLMLLAIRNPDKLPIILDSDICTEELVNYNSDVYGNILNVLAMNNIDHIDHILNSRYMNKELLGGTSRYIDDDDTAYDVNIFFTLIKDSDNIQKLINSEYFSKEILLCSVGDVDIFSEAIVSNINVLPLLINAVDNISDILILQGYNMLQYCVKHNIDVATNILNKQIDNNILLLKDENEMNLLMYILKICRKDNEESYDDIINIIIDKYLTKELLLDTDNNDISTCEYAFKYAPEKFFDFCEMHELLDNYISFYNIVFICKNEDIVRKILYKFRKKINNNPSILHLIIKHNVDNLNYVLELDSITEDVFNAKDSDNNNILSSAIKHNAKCSTIISILLNRYFSSEMLMARDSEGNTPLITAVCSYYNAVRLILSSNYMTKEIFEKSVYPDEDLLTLACRKSNDIKVINILRRSKFYDSSYFSRTDYSNYTCLTYALENSPEIAEYMLNDELCTAEMYKSEVQKYLLHKDDMSPDILRIIVDTPYCNSDILKELFLDSISMNVNLTRHIIRSDKCTKEVIFSKDKDNNNCFHIADNLGYYSLINDILDSKFNCCELIIEENNEGRSLLKSLVDKESYNLILLCLKEFDKIGDTDRLWYILSTLKDDVPLLLILSINYNILKEILSLQNISIYEAINNLVDNNNLSCLHYVANSSMNLDQKIDILNILAKGDMVDSMIIKKYDNIGNTFLNYCPPLLGVVLEYDHLCTRELFEGCNNVGYNTLSFVLSEYTSLAKKLLESKYVTKDILTPTNLFIALGNDSRAIDIILESELCDNNIINSTLADNIPLLVFAILQNNINYVKKLLDSPYDLSESFNMKDSLMRNIITISIHISLDMFDIILNSKYFKKDLLLEKDIYGHNAISYTLCKSLDALKYMINNNIWESDMILQRDNSGDTLLMCCINDSVVIEYLSDNNMINNDIIKERNNIDQTCLHIFMTKNDQCMKILSDRYDLRETLKYQDKYGNTCMHAGAIIQNNAIMKDILNSDNITSDVFDIQNNDKKTILMLAMENDLDVTFTILNHPRFNKESLYITDKNGNNALMYAVRYFPDVINKILELAGKDILDKRNNKYETAVMYASYYSLRSTKILLLNINIELKHLYNGHTDHPSILTIAMRYQPLVVKLLMDIQPDENIIICNDEDGYNAVKIGCIYNSESLKYLLNSTYRLDILFNNIYTPHPIILAARYQPDAVKYILESEYGSSKLFDIEWEDKTCINEAFDNQPKALCHIIRSKHLTEEILSREDAGGCTLLYRIKRIYRSKVDNIHDVLNLELADSKNIIADDNDPNICNICYTYKKNIIISPCFHTLCVGCAFKIKRCPMCKKDIEHRSEIFF